MTGKALLITDTEVDILELFLEKLRQKQVIWHGNYMFIFSGLSKILIMYICSSECNANNVASPDVVANIKFEIVPAQVIGKEKAKLIIVKEIQLQWPYYVFFKDSLEPTKEFLPGRVMEVIQKIVLDLLVEE